jgi:SAM-dependent methyltransferase
MPPAAPRDPAALRRHYEVERELADRLRAAPAYERKTLYRDVYAELFRRVPDHPQLTSKREPDEAAARGREPLRWLGPFLRPGSAFVDVGCGDAALARAAAARVGRAYGIDVADLVPADAHPPGNFELRLTDGTDLPLPDGSADVVFSNMLIEHFHPDDARAHLREVHRVLAPGGVYVCRTPHAYAGPQDVSQFFDTVATGFHLKEYTYQELRSAFREAGFARTGVLAAARGVRLPVPGPAFRLAEWGLGALPARLRKWACARRGLRQVIGCLTVVGRKGGPPC